MKMQPLLSLSLTHSHTLTHTHLGAHGCQGNDVNAVLRDPDTAELFLALFMRLMLDERKCTEVLIFWEDEHLNLKQLCEDLEQN